MSIYFRPEAVGQSLIMVLKQGQHGSLWVCEDNGLVYEIEISTLEAAKKESLKDNWNILTQPEINFVSVSALHWNK